MNERERFDKYFDGAKPGNKGFELHMLAGWDARAEIAKQDEKELIEALIETLYTKVDPDPYPSYKTCNYCSASDAYNIYHKIVHEKDCRGIKLIEKHMGKTWEELNG